MDKSKCIYGKHTCVVKVSNQQTKAFAAAQSKAELVSTSNNEEKEVRSQKIEVSEESDVSEEPVAPVGGKKRRSARLENYMRGKSWKAYKVNEEIGTQTCYIHQCTYKVMLMYIACLCPNLLCNPYITLKIS